MITITITGRRICGRSDGDPVTTGSVGYPVEFGFDPAWDGLDKIAVFRGSNAEAQRTLSEDTTTIPPEVLTVAGSILWIGVRGENADGSLVIPTLWLRVGYLPEGVGEAEIPERQLPPGGTTGQVLTKLSDADYDAGWGDAEAGFSPAVTVTEISGGHRVTITDAEHPVVGQSFDVMDGDSGGGMTETAIQLLETILTAAVYTSDQSDNIDALIEELQGGGGEGVSISFAGTTATIINLAGTGIAYSGTTATIGGN